MSKEVTWSVVACAVLERAVYDKFFSKWQLLVSTRKAAEEAAKNKAEHTLQTGREEEDETTEKGLPEQESAPETTLQQLELEEYPAEVETARKKEKEERNAATGGRQAEQRNLDSKAETVKSPKQR